MAVLFVTGVSILVIILFLLSVGVYQKTTNAMCLSKKNLDGKTALVTGGTAGMGLEIAKNLARRGARVIVASPFEDEGLSALKTIIESSRNENIVFKCLNLASLESTRSLATDILMHEDRLDILINNAGVGGPENILSPDGLNFVMQVNYYGAFLLTVLLLPLLKKTGRPGEPSRIVNTTSLLHIFGRSSFNNLKSLNSWPFEVYGSSKLYLLLFSRELTKRLEGSNVVINTVDPGIVGTKIYLTAYKTIGSIAMVFFSILFKTAREGAQTALHVVLDEKAGTVSGEVFRNCRQARAARKAYNDKLAKKLWEETVCLVMLSNEELTNCLYK